jgi:hypothetical protein
MSLHGGGKVKAEFPIGFQEPYEVRDMMWEAMRVKPTQAHIKIILFSKAPSITFHVRTKVEFRHFRPNGTSVGLTRSHLEFSLLSDNRDFGVTISSQKPSNGTEVATRADNKLSLDLPVDGPMVTRSFERLQRGALEDACTAAGQQKLIKFNSSYPVADGFAVIGFDLRAAYAARPKSRKRLENTALRILSVAYLKFLKHRRRDPPTADFIPWKYALVENEHVET